MLEIDWGELADELKKPGWLSARQVANVSGEWRAEPYRGGWRLICDYGERYDVVRPINRDECLVFASLDTCRSWLRQYAGVHRFLVVD